MPTVRDLVKLFEKEGLLDKTIDELDLTIGISEEVIKEVGDYRDIRYTDALISWDDGIDDAISLTYNTWVSKECPE